MNRFPTTSTYRWEDEIHHDDEAVLLAKTTDEADGTLVDRLTELHPYDAPCIERFDEENVLESVAAWRDESVRE